MRPVLPALLGQRNPGFRQDSQALMSHVSPRGLLEWVRRPLRDSPSKSREKNTSEPDDPLVPQGPPVHQGSRPRVPRSRGG